MPHPRPSWPRRLRRLSLLLLLGLATTVGVAWGLALVLPMNVAHSSHLDLPGNSRTKDQREDSLNAISYIRFGSVRRLWYYSSYRRYALVSPPWSMFVIDAPRGETTAVFTWSLGGPLAWGELADQLGEFKEGRLPQDGLDEARGWPALAFWAGYRGFLAYDQTDPLEVYGGVQLEASAHPGQATTRPNAATVRAIPLLPIWPGLTFNTVFYALLWWLGFSSVGMVKQIRRYRRGLCPICRYDLRSDYSGGCSECGWHKP